MPVRAIFAEIPRETPVPCSTGCPQNHRIFSFITAIRKARRLLILIFVIFILRAFMYERQIKFLFK